MRRGGYGAPRAGCALMRPALRAVLLAALGGLATPAPAQDGLAMGQVQSPVLTLDLDRLLAETAYGRRLSADILARGEALDAENERIAAELTARERSLTERRPAMDPDAFRAEADAFDAEVRRIREEQDAKQRELEAAVAEGRVAFIEVARPVLGQLMRESGAAVIIERRDVFLSASLVDVTDEAIAAIDAAVGEGEGTATPGAPLGQPTEEPSDGGEAAPPAVANPAPGPAPQAAPAPGAPGGG